ncbi:hypothetical protein KI387_022728, partial [Taxus chinensis]
MWCSRKSKLYKRGSAVQGVIGMGIGLEGAESVLEAVAVLAVIVTVHECGHFLAAYFQRIHVSKFAIGFGPTLLKFDLKNVECSVRAIPVGGYVGFPDNDQDSRIPSDDKDLLKNKPILDRLLVTVADLLTQACHTVSSLDNASAGIDPRDADNITSLEEYNQPLTDFFTALPAEDKVILVGHSLGGYNLSYTMERFPHKIGAAVFVTAFMPLSGTTLSESMKELGAGDGSLGDSTFYYANGNENQPASYKSGIQFSKQFIAQNSPSWDLTLFGSLEKKSPLWQEPL